MKSNILPTNNRIFLAPMEEVNDIAFRLICKRNGAGLTWTGLTSPLSPKELNLDDEPVLQIFSVSPRGISEFMKRYDSLVFGWDFNLGCPATMARKHGYGAYLINLEVIEEILRMMRENTRKPLCVKIRKSPRAYEILKIAEKYCDWIAIHPRTREQGYAGEPDISWAKEFKKKSKIPVIYSGNVTRENAEELLKTFDYVMIGRGAIGHPEIFGGKRDFYEYLELAKKHPLPFRQIKFQAMQFSKGEKGSRELRSKLIYAKNISELLEIWERSRKIESAGIT